MRVRVLGASVLMLMLAACGDHPPKDDGDDEDPPAQAAISIVAGSATESGSADGTGSAARFSNPTGIGIDAAGNLYVADRGNRTIRKITPAGVVTTLAGSAGAAAASTDGAGGNARFADPVALTLDRNGNLYVTDELRIRSVSPAGQVATAALIPVGSNVDGRALPAVYSGGIAVDNQVNFYVTNSYGTRRLTGSMGGVLEGSFTMDNLFGMRPFEPRGIATDSSSFVYAADLQQTISKTNNVNLLTRLAGTAGVTGSSDGTGAAASFRQVVALTVDAQGNVYAADHGNNLVRKITQAGVVTTVAGNRNSQTLTPGALPGSLAGVRGIATDGKNLYVTSGQAVVKIILP